ncbi:P-loop containing nucleoside triphosphate hydrolase protein [Chlamydoabsidia padenii]|nr:P-loop containing nucleoside triphosphate hydrolase protein [Chlamydoabsidia padenii]
MTLALASQPSLRSLYITPNQELASQVNRWIQQLAPDTSCLKADTSARLLEEVSSLGTIDRIVLDEADQALRLPKRYASLRQQQQRQTHPKPAQLLLSHLMHHHQHKPQLIVSSATLNRPLRHWLTLQGWMNPDPVFIDITKGNQVPVSPAQHYCLMVSDDSIRNMTPVSEDITTKTPPPMTSFDDQDDRMLESIAILHDLESTVLKNSVLFVDSSTSTATIQSRLASYNIHARDIRDAHQPQPLPTLWIATEFTARGIDLDSISHVFILGKPPSIASYLHMAGRTGRLGPDGYLRPGKIISLVRDHGRSETKMVNMYKLMNISVKPLEHVE